MLNIQDALESKYPAFFKRSNIMSQPVISVLKMLTHEKEMQQFGQTYPNCTGLDFAEKVLEFFQFSIAVRQNEKERILPKGRVVLIANHPIGSLDGLALLQMVSDVRPDVKVVGSKVLDAIPALESVRLPISSKKSASYHDELGAIKQHLENEGAVIIFPAGNVSRMSATGIKDDRWHTTFLTVAEETHSPILPIYIDARNSLFFYSLSLLSKPLSTLWLVRETFKHTDNSVVIRIGELVDPSGHQDLNLPLKTKSKLFRKQVYRLPKGKPSLFKTISPIAHPENRQLLKKEIENCERLGETRDGKRIYLYHYSPDSVVLREMGRLREEAFRLIGEGTGNRRDIDVFDQHYQHIVLWDAEDLEIVGAYRLSPTRAALNKEGREQIYTTTLFNYQDEAEHILRTGLELGRSFVQPKYWGSRSLDYLWYGIAAFLQRHPQYRYLIGAVSISNSFSRPAKDLLVHYYHTYYGVHQVRNATSDWVHCHRPYTLDEASKERIDAMFKGLTAKEAFILLKEQLSHLGYSVPTLYKQYTELCNPGGSFFLGFNIDPDFNDCVDGLVVVDINELAAMKRKRYGLIDHEVVDESANDVQGPDSELDSAI